jgi:hypothetical protein
LKRIALLFQILAIELYNTCGKKVNAELQTVLNQLPSHLTDWSDLVLNSLPSSSSPAGKDKTSLDFLLSGWSDFLVMLAHYGPATEVGTRAKISTDVLESLTGRAESGHHSPLLGKLAELNWMLQLVEKKSNSQMLSGLGRLLVVVAEKELTSFPARFQVAVLTSAVSALRLRSETDTDKELSTWMRCVSLCSIMSYSTTQVVAYRNQQSQFQSYLYYSLVPISVNRIAPGCPRLVRHARDVSAPVVNIYHPVLHTSSTGLGSGRNCFGSPSRRG